MANPGDIKEDEVMATKRSGARNGRSQQGRPSSTSKRGTYRRNTYYGFHIELKHILGGISLISLLAAFEIFSIPAANGIIDLFILSKVSAAQVWIGTAFFTGLAALYLHGEE